MKKVADIKSVTLPRVAMVPALFVMSSLSLMHAQDPFTTADNPFSSGWKRLTSVPVTGVFASSDGQTSIAWGTSGFQISKDRGVSWSNSVVPGAFTGSSAVPVVVGTSAVAEAVLAGQDAYIRSYDGVVRGVDGAPRNQAWNIQAVSRIAVAGNGTLFVLFRRLLLVVHLVTAKSSSNSICKVSCCTASSCCLYKSCRAGILRCCWC